MARISEEILSNVDIVDVIGKYVHLKRAGSNFSGLCPFHNEKSPSFMVSPQKQIFKCFGCGVGGNVITFVKEIERVDFWDAAKILAKDTSIDMSQFEKNYQKYEEMNQGKEKIKRLHKLSQDLFVSALHKSTDAMSYLKDTRKLDEETINTFGIGYAPESHSALLQELKSKGFGDDDLIESSLAKRGQSGDAFAFFRNRITFPIYDSVGNVIAFSARILDPNDKPKYLNSSEHMAFEKSRVLYGLNLVKKHIKEHNFIIVVEGQMDVISLHQLGYPVAVATCGTSLTEEHVKLIKRYTDHVYFLFDNDDAGQKATIRGLKIAYQQDLFPKLISLPEQYKDADDLAQEADGKEKFQGFLDNAIDAFLSIYTKLRDSWDMNSPVDKQKLMNTMFGIIIGLPNPSTQIHYITLLAEHMGLSYEVMSAQYQQYAKSEGKFVMRQKQSSSKSEIYQPSRDDILISLFRDQYLLSLFAEDDTAQKVTALGEHVATLLPDSPLGLIKKFVDEEHSEKIKEAQLWREKELETALDTEAKLKLVKRIIAPSLQHLVQQIRKLPSIAQDDKQAIYEEMRGIKW